MTFSYLLGLGGNIEPRLSFLKSAHESLSKAGEIVQRSSLYVTPPLGPADTNFLNCAIILDTQLGPENLLIFLKNLEENLGRKPGIRWGNRCIDIDILLGCEGDQKAPVIHSSDSLLIPHRHMLVRDFVLDPAVEIAGGWVHPKELMTLFEIRLKTPRHDPDYKKFSW